MGRIAVIPARSGSKGLKDKNIRMLNGKPLLAYSVEAAIQSGAFDVIHVSTDSEQYAGIAKKYGADVPFLRNKETSTDDATTWDAMRYVLREYEKRGHVFDSITVLQPTSPLRTATDIKEALDFFDSKNANMVSSVCEMDHSPLWSNVLPEDCSMEQFEDEKIAYMPRQKLPTYYRENGAVFIVKVVHLFTAENIYKPGSFAFIMNKLHSVDIDDVLDFKIAEVLLQEKAMDLK